MGPQSLAGREARRCQEVRGGQRSQKDRVGPQSLAAQVDRRVPALRVDRQTRVVPEAQRSLEGRRARQGRLLLRRQAGLARPVCP